MSAQSARDFLQYVRSHPEVVDEMRAEIRARGRVDNTVVGRKHGFEFTHAEADAIWADVMASGDDLTDFELEAVSAGGNNPVNGQGNSGTVDHV